jgi:hypothetical protein
VKRLKSLLCFGLLPGMSRGAREEVWLHSRGRLGWARTHVAERHRVPVGQVVSLRVKVPRAWLVRRGKGLWTCDRVVPASMVQAVNISALVA